MSVMGARAAGSSKLVAPVISGGGGVVMEGVQLQERSPRVDLQQQLKDSGGRWDMLVSPSPMSSWPGFVT